MLSHDDNERLCRIGPGTPMGNLFRRFWLPALLVAEVPAPDSPPKRLRILGEDLVAFRDTGGRVGIVEAYCPHKLAQLFWGRNEDCGLRCAYHGWKFDVDGKCVDIPNVADAANLRRKMAITAYPTREAGGVVWVYMGPAELEPELPALEWTELDSDRVHVSRWLQGSNWAQGMEGEIDSTHISFLHSATADEYKLPRPFSAATPDVAAGPPELTIRETEHGFTYGTRRNTPRPDEYFWRITQWLVPMFSLIANQDYPRGGRAWVPVDDEHVTTFAYMFNRDRPFTQAENEALGTGFYFPPRLTQGAHALPDGYVIDTFVPSANRGNDYLIDRDLQRTSNFSGIFGTNEQDRAIQETMRSAPGARHGAIADRTRERLVASDTPVITARRILLRLAAALENGVEPPQPGNGDLYRVRAIAALSPHADLDSFLAAHRSEVTVPSSL
jgi:phenylpropionate dioxygenase-like ring-hydroxylating dioxygenase large terminal subunit